MALVVFNPILLEKTPKFVLESNMSMLFLPLNIGKRSRTLSEFVDVGLNLTQGVALG